MGDLELLAIRERRCFSVFRMFGLQQYDTNPNAAHCCIQRNLVVQLLIFAYTRFDSCECGLSCWLPGKMFVTVP